MKNEWSGLCRGCHEQAPFKKRLEEIRAGFQAPGETEAQIGDAFFKSLGLQKITAVDIQFASELSTALSREGDLEIRSWADALRISKKLGIRYTTRRRTRYHPVFAVAEALEKAGKIPADYATAARLERSLAEFNPVNRPTIERYLDEAVGQGSTQSKMKMAARLLDFERYVAGENLFDHDPECAQAYVRQLPVRQGKETYSEFMRLRRFFRWSVKEGHLSVNPYADWRPVDRFAIPCEACGKTRTARNHSRLCDTCFQKTSTLLSHAPLAEIAQSFRAPSAYNQHLFSLYISYLKRHAVLEPHLATTKALMSWLESRPIDAIRSWSEVASLSREFNKEQKQPLLRGCPIAKIGKMLQELGVLPLREIDREIQAEKLIDACPEISRILGRYHEQLKKMDYRSRSRYGTIRMLLEVQYWLRKHHPEHTLVTAGRELLAQYIVSLGNQDRGGIRRYVLRRFYRWMRLEKLVLVNPMEGDRLPRSIRKLCVCTDQQIRKIESFVKNPDSDPEQALFLTLSLYWGFNAKDLAFASMEIHDSQIWILAHRQPLTRGRHSHYRDQVLKLPVTPEWLGRLQKRYIQAWRVRFDKVQKNFPVQPLVLAKGRNRHLSSISVMDLFYKATLAATGIKIPSSVVRRTSAHIHTHYGDATRLAKLGWAKRHCHDFSVYARTYFTPKA
jgi:site-specific recombinase XerC